MLQEGLMFPKGKQKKKRKKHPKSIIPGNRKNYCYICERYGYTEKHHIFGGSNRENSEKYGLTVYLCPDCHREGKIAVHKCKESSNTLKRIGQHMFEEQCGSREEFIKVFGKNYLEDTDD